MRLACSASWVTHSTARPARTRVAISDVHRRHRSGIEGRGRFIEQQHPWPNHQRTNDRRSCSRSPVESRVIGQAFTSSGKPQISN